MQPDVTALIILGICVVLFLTEWIPLAVTGCLGCLLMVLFGVSSFEEAFSGFSSDIVLLMASALVVGIAMLKTGAAQVIGRMVIRWSHGNERVFLTVSCMVAGLLSMFLANTAILAMFFPIVESVCVVSPNMRRRNLVLPLACSVMFGGACTLVGCTPQLTANGLMRSMVGEEMGMWTLTGPGLCLFVLFLVFAVTVGYWQGKKAWNSRPEETLAIDEEHTHAVVHAMYDNRKLVLMFSILAFMLVFYSLSILSTAVTAICAALACLIFGCCSVKDVVREMHWESVVFLASCLGLAEALTNSGAGELLGHGVAWMLGDVRSPMVVFAALTFLALFISQFITNSTAIIIVLPIALSLCTQYGFQYMPFCVGITLAASIACCTPLAAAQITMTQIAGYKFSDYLKYGWLLSLVEYICILVFVPMFFPLV